jgi:hypothetical protein
VPHIIVMAEGEAGLRSGEVMLRERINPSDLQSRHFANHLIERLKWAVEDARELELNRPDQDYLTHDLDWVDALQPTERFFGRRDGDPADEADPVQAPARLVTTAS